MALVLTAFSGETEKVIGSILAVAFVAHVAYRFAARPRKCKFLTNHELKIVQESWAEVAKLGAETVGVLLFKNIFTAAPSALAFFSFKDEVNLYESRAFKKHAISVVNTVGVAVGSLEDLVTLVPILKTLGEKHTVMGTEGNRIVKAHYDLVGAQLLVTLELGLGKKWTPELKVAWSKVYGVVGSTMLGQCPAHK